MPQDLSYSATAQATAGQSPRVATQDKGLDMPLVTPEELGGDGGDGANAEQLLAAGYAACFLSALRFGAAKQAQTLPPDTRIDATVQVAQSESRSFTADISVEVDAPSVGADELEALVAAAREAWPYSGSVGEGQITVRPRGDGAAPGGDDPVRQVREEAASNPPGYGG